MPSNTSKISINNAVAAIWPAPLSLSEKTYVGGETSYKKIKSFV